MKRSNYFGILVILSLLSITPRSSAQFSMTGRDASIGIFSSRVVEDKTSDTPPFDVISPLAWVETKAYRTERTVVIRWTTSTQVNVKCFQIESSYNGRDWKIVTSNIRAFALPGISRYQQSVELRKHRKTFYRIRYEDYDGSGGYSSIISFE